MDIGVPLRDLGQFDVTGLREVVMSLDEDAWRGTEYRQESYDVHAATQSVVMVFTDGSGWPDIEVRKEAGWDLLAKQAVPLMHEIIDQHYPPGGSIIRAMAVKLIPGGVIKPHTDKHASFHHAHRIHIPLVSSPRVRFMLDGRPYRFEVGTVYEINNQRKHSVMNKGDEGRVNFIFDYLPPQHLGQRAGEEVG